MMNPLQCFVYLTFRTVLAGVLVALPVWLCCAPAWSAEPAPTNVALNRPVTASVDAPNLARITDGAVSALDGAAEQGYAQLLHGPQWIRIDLGQYFEVSKIHVWHYFNDGRTYRDVAVQLSNDDEFVDEVTTVFNNDADNTLFQGAGKDAEYAETRDGKAITVQPPVVARYVRLWSNGSGANALNHYTEVQVFGTPAASSKVPAPPKEKVRMRATVKKLIAFPRVVEPYPAFMRKHIAEMEKTPFDGTVFSLKYTRADGTTGDFQWESWGKVAITEEQIKEQVADLQATKFTRFKHNFLRFNTASRNHDWFDDFSAILHNARLAASVARRANEATGAVPGIKFDPEQYNDKLFTYPAQRDRATKTWEQYAAQARKRGREVMEAFQEGYPDLTVFMSIGYSGAWYEAQRGKPLSEVEYGLLAPFMDGMTEAARGKTRIVDGYELGYYLEPETLHFGYRAMAQDLLPIVADVKKYRQVTSLGFGLWLDKNYDTWNAEDVTKNHWTPERFQTLVRTALELSDEYVWIYSDKKPQWWSEDGKPHNIPPAYFEALRKARKGLAVE